MKYRVVGELLSRGQLARAAKGKDAALWQNSSTSHLSFQRSAVVQSWSHLKEHGAHLSAHSQQDVDGVDGRGLY